MVFAGNKRSSIAKNLLAFTSTKRCRMYGMRMLYNKRSMSKKQFRQEFEASFETATGRIYEEFGDHNLTDRELQSHEAIHWAHDQNFTPLSSSISVVEGHSMFIVGEIVLESAVSSQSAEEFVERYRDHRNKMVYI